MNREEPRRRALPATNSGARARSRLRPESRGPRRRNGLRFLRASRFRVSDDVAARKHIGVPGAQAPNAAPASTNRSAGGSQSPPRPGDRRTGFTPCRRAGGSPVAGRDGALHDPHGSQSRSAADWAGKATLATRRQLSLGPPCRLDFQPRAGRSPSGGRNGRSGSMLGRTRLGAVR
jgi:hypothetical protein